MMYRIGLNFVALTLLASSPAIAENFTIESGVVVNTPQFLTDPEDRGVVEKGGLLTTAPTAVIMSNNKQEFCNKGEVLTSDHLAHGVDSSGANSSIENKGFITTSGNSSSGISNDGANTTIINLGTITTNGFISIGILNGGKNVSIENRGSIFTTDSGSNGIQNNADFVDVVNSGLITISGGSTDGIRNFGIRANVINTGVINSTGDGIRNFGEGSTVDNRGSIVASGIEGNGVENTNNSALIKNRGTISTLGLNGDGICNGGSSVSIVNIGLIDTSGPSSDGIDNQGSCVSITNSGKIITSGSSAIGISNEGSCAMIINEGKIYLSNQSGNGMYNSGSGSVIINSGSITTAAENVAVVLNKGSQVDFNNCGTIFATASGSDGVLIDSAHQVHLSNSGVIKSEQGFAIRFINSENPILTLKKGSNIQGDLESTHEIKINANKGLNLILTLTDASAGFEILNIEDPFVYDNAHTIAVVDRTGFAMQEDVAQDISDTITSCVRKHCCFYPGEYGCWTASAGSYRNRKKHNQTVSYFNWQLGQMFGYNKCLNSGTLNLFGGALYGKAEIDGHTQRAKTYTYFGGFSYSKVICSGCMGITLAAGAINWENERDVQNNLAANGEEIAKFKKNGVILASELCLSRPFCINKFTPEATLSIGHTGLYLNKYREKGSSANVKVKNRDIDLLRARIELAFPAIWRTACFCVDPYLGIYDRFQLCGNNVKISLLNDSIDFNSGSSQNQISYFIGFNMIKSPSQRVQLDYHANIEAEINTSHSSRVLGCVRISF